MNVYETSIATQFFGHAMHPGGLKLTTRVAQTAEIDSFSRVLDIGCGYGITTSFLSQNYGCRVAGIDLSAKLISLAKSKIKVKQSALVDLVVSDAERLPFKDLVFDAVISECTFSLLPNKEVTARQIMSVLKSGGRLVITDVIIQGRLSNELKTQATFDLCFAGALPLEGYIQIFLDAGFVIPYVEDHSEELKRIYRHVMNSCCSVDNFLASINQPSCYCSSTTASQSLSMKLWQRLFVEGKPGYAMITVKKP